MSGKGGLGATASDAAMQMVGTEISRARKAAGLARGELGELIGLTEDEVRRLEAGKRSPSVDFLARLAAVCGRRLTVQIVPDPKRPPRSRLRRYCGR